MAMLARTPTRATMRKRRYRHRLRNGIVVLRVEVDEAELAEAMILAERLSERESAKRAALARAAESVLREFTQRWRKHKI
jgi:hypothetical protein